MPDLEPRVAVLEARIDGLAAEVHALHGEIQSLRTDMLGEFRAMRAEHARDFRWVIGIMLASWGSLLAVMAHGFHWY